MVAVVVLATQLPQILEEEVVAVVKAHHFITAALAAPALLS
jgi:hypothetical protein